MITVKILLKIVFTECITEKNESKHLKKHLLLLGQQIVHLYISNVLDPSSAQSVCI